MKGASISGIYRQAHGSAPIGAEATRRNKEAMAEAWHKRGMLVVNPEDINDDWERQQLVNVGNELYGKRKEET